MTHRYRLIAAVILFAMLITPPVDRAVAGSTKRLKAASSAQPLSHAAVVALSAGIRAQLLATGGGQSGRTASPALAAMLTAGTLPAAKFSGDAGLNVESSPTTGLAAVIRNIGDDANRILASAASPKEKTERFVLSHPALFRMSDPSAELSVVSSSTDDNGATHVSFAQMFDGAPVWGHDLVAHYDAAGNLYYLNAHTIPTPSSATALSASMTAERAIAAAVADNATLARSVALDPAWHSVLQYDGPTSGAIVWADEAKGVARRAWKVEIRPNLRDLYRYFIDAQTGAVLERYNATAFDGPATATANDLNNVSRTVHSYQVGSTYFMIDASRSIWAAAQPGLPNDPRGALWTLDVRGTDLDANAQIFHVASSNNSWTDKASVSAQYNVGKVFEYYSTKFNRRAIDDAGSTIISVIHVTENGHGMDNAYWNGQMMAYGDGNQAFKPLAGGLDVAAHEMTHGVIERTIGLEYKNQSGALNESFADVFGVMVDDANWTMGEDVVNTAFFPSGALRSMSDPHNGGSGPSSNGWQPASMAEFQNLTIQQDNGGVHVNSGIPNRACYLIGNAIGRAKTEQIYYRIMKNKYLNQQATFADLRAAAIQSATELYGGGSAEVTAVTNAFASVGIGTSGGSQPPVDNSKVDGAQWIALVNNDAGDKSLYKIHPTVLNDTDAVHLSSTQVYDGTGNPLSVSDNGGLILFIDENNFIRSIHSDGSGEAVLSAEGTWSSLALSPDAKHLAATSVYSDSVIYLFDLVNTANSTVIQLYSPTTQDGVKSFVTEYADALSWSPDGSVLLYDAFNRVQQSGGTDLTYWDINAVTVADGKIYRIFPPQPKGIDLGNPSFSRNTDRYFVFDYITETGDTVYAVDLFKGTANFVLANGASLGIPRYSPDDGAMLFQRYTAGEPGVYRIGLNADKVHASGSAVGIVTKAMLGTWYAQGARVTGVGEQAAVPFAPMLFQNYPNPFNPSTTISYDLPARVFVSVKVFNALGQQVALLAEAVQDVGRHELRWNASAAPSGVYYYQLNTPAGVTMKRAVLIK